MRRANVSRDAVIMGDFAVGNGSDATKVVPFSRQKEQMISLVILVPMKGKIFIMYNSADRASNKYQKAHTDYI